MKIYDCFIFYNELEILELRLALLAPYVDYFVLVESDTTHRGDKKQLYFDEQKGKFAEYKDKIIHIKMNGTIKGTVPNDWSIENTHRNYIEKGLVNCSPEDIIIISDADEIPNPQILQRLKNGTLQSKQAISKLHRVFRKRKDKLAAYGKYIKILNKFCRNKSVNDILQDTPLAFFQDHYYYFMNYKHPDKWCGSVISLYKNMDNPQHLRDIRRRLPVINNGGWHFAYMGGMERILLKVNSTVDENPTALHNKEYDVDYIKKCVNRGSLIYDYQNDEENIFSLDDINEIGIPNIEKFAQKYPYLFWNDNSM